MESYKFNNIVQTEGQPFIDFETSLRKQLQLCDYKCNCGQKYEERMFLDRLIIGIHDKSLQLKLLDRKNKKLEEIITECKAYEAATKNNEFLQNQNRLFPEKTINAVIRRCCNFGSIFNPNHLSECRAKETTCYACGKSGHFAKYCKQQHKRVDNSNRRMSSSSNSNGRVNNNQSDVDHKRAAGGVIN
ncbi:hypothetical protein KR054_010174 [Drosophila jambulina]|nr:hypothetical protein KR054_010174 [Drosophila jambulina]